MKLLSKANSERAKRILSDPLQRVLAAAGLSCAWDLLYALFNLVSAALSQSQWLFTMGVYYAVLCFLRASALSFGHVDRARRTEATLLKHNGIVLCALAAVAAGIVVLTIDEKRNPNYGTILTIAAAAFTSVMLVLAVRNAARARREKQPRVIILRDISLSGAVMSVFSLERSMLAAFGDTRSMFSYRMEGMSGIAAVLIILFLGTGLIRRGLEMPRK